MIALILALIAQFILTILNALQTPPVFTNVGFGLILALVWFFAIWILTDLIAYAKLHRLLPILTVQCDPDRFLEAVLPLALIPGLEPFTRTTLQQFVAMGLESFGDFDKALNWLQDCHRSEKPAGNAYFNAVVDYSLARLHLRRQDVASFQEYRGRLASHADALSKKASLRDSYSVMVKHLDVVDGIQQGELAGSVEFFEGLLLKAKVELERVNNHFNLAEVHEALGDETARRRCLAYAAEHGNGLHSAKMARFLLESA
jgi:hypothetical protein